MCYVEAKQPPKFISTVQQIAVGYRTKAVCSETEPVYHTWQCTYKLHMYLFLYLVCVLRTTPDYFTHATALWWEKIELYLWKYPGTLPDTAGEETSMSSFHNTDAISCLFDFVEQFMHSSRASQKEYLYMSAQNDVFKICGNTHLSMIQFWVVSEFIPLLQHIMHITHIIYSFNK